MEARLGRFIIFMGSEVAGLTNMAPVGEHPETRYDGALYELRSHTQCEGVCVCGCACVSVRYQQQINVRNTRK